MKEIVAGGGKALANYANVCNTDEILKPVLDEFGKVDILINNAGILRDRSFLRISPDDWQSILDVHLTASFNLTQKCFEVMKKNQYGRIINTSRESFQALKIALFRKLFNLTPGQQAN